MSKYNVGDKVKVREDLNYDIKCQFGVTSKMLEYKGKEVAIVSVWKDGVSYHIEGSIYDWEDVMFEGLATKEIKSGFKVGDRVKVREDLVVDEIYGGDSFVYDMAEFRGKEVTIKEIQCAYHSYRIKETGYNWTEEMFEGYKKAKAKPKYVRCITNEFELIHKDGIYEVLKEEYVGYILKQGRYSRKYFIEVDSPVEPYQSVPNKGTIKYRITDDGITYTTLGHNSGKSVKSGKDESNNEIGILIATARALGFNEDKISGIVDVLFDNDSYDSKAKCDNAIIKNDIARALSILDRYK